MEHIYGRNRNQTQMMSLEEMVDKQSLVRIIDAFVEVLDLEQFEFNYFKLNKKGRPPFHPATMMKFYLYGYQNSIRSCRKLEKTCKTNLTYQWTMVYKKLKNGRQSYQVKHYKAKACDGCLLRTQCTTNKLGRIIERTEYQQYVDRNNNRVLENPEYYRERQQIIEHQFGTLKRQWHFDYTLTKTKEKVLGEVYQHLLTITSKEQYLYWISML